MPSTPNQERAGHCPTQDLVDAYEMANGQIPILGYEDDEHLIPKVNPESGYDENNPYKNRDPRFYATIFYNGAQKSSQEEGYEEYELVFQLGSNNHMEIEEEDGVYHINTTGGDPYIMTSELEEELKFYPTIELTFEYKSSTGIVSPEIFFSPIAGGRSTRYSDIPAASEWTTHSINITESVSDLEWGQQGDLLRFDTGDDQNKEIVIRNIKVQEFSMVSTYNVVETFVGGADEISSSNRRNTRTGYYLKKYFNPNSRLGNVADGYTRLFRLAGVYLNFAESAYQSNGPDVTMEVGSQQMSARDAVNKIRERAGMPDLPENLSIEAFEKRYRNERRVELAYEEHRFFDVRRWMILDQTDQFVTGLGSTYE